MRWMCLWLALCGALLFTVGASAQDAEALFQQGLDLMREGRFGAACPMLAQSQRLDPKSGTLISLAFCYERTGKTATAYASYEEAARLAKTEDRADYVEKAEGLMTALEPTLSKIRIAPPDIVGLEVRLDGVIVPKAKYRTDFPVDPGRHTVVAIAPNRETWTGYVDVGDSGDRQTVSIPTLENSEATEVAPPPPPQPPPPPPKSNGMTIVGWTLVGVGGAATAVGLVLGGLVLGKKSTVESECDLEDRICTDEGLAARDSGKTLSTASTALVVVGLVAAAGGVTLVLVDDASTNNDTVALRLQPRMGGATLGLEARF
jgi:hypothetical protein